MEEIPQPPDISLETSLDVPLAQQLLNDFQSLLDQQPEQVDEPDEQIEPFDLDQAQQMLAQFKRLSFPVAAKTTFLDIVGLRYQESISSKLLAFFLDSKAEHGLGDLCLQSLFELAGQPQSSKINTIDLVQEQHCSNQDAGAAGRIDLLIETDDFVVAIENKINHVMNNPFALYRDHCYAKYPDHQKLLVILGLNPPDKLPEHFVFVSHYDLYRHIKQQLPAHLLRADHHYLTFLLDYISTFEAHNPNSETGKMEQAIVDFYRNNLDLLTQIMDNKHHVQTYYQQQVDATVQELSGLLDQDLFGENESQENDDGGDFQLTGAYRASTDFPCQHGDYSFSFYVSYNLSGATLGYYRWVKRSSLKEAKLASAWLHEQGIQHQYDEGDWHISLAVLPESILPTEFAAQTAPIIEAVLAAHGYQGSVTNP